MRDELNILWVDDSDDWIESEKGILNRDLEDMKIRVNWETIVDASKLYKRVQNQSSGFGSFDIFLIDYNLSLKIEENGNEKEIRGDELIRSLRNIIDVDIVFYSSIDESKIYDIISDDLNTYQGVYISDRNLFRDKVMKIIRKNSRKLNELSNIRGFLTNQTSENDFIVNSTIYKCFESLDKDLKKEYLNELSHGLNQQFEKCCEIQKKFMLELDKIYKKIDCDEATNIRKLLREASFLITQADRYSFFNSIIKNLEADISRNIDVDQYLNKIVKMRNTLAHKKLELCEEKHYIKFADDIGQIKKCPPECISRCNSEEFISIERWEELKKEVYEYSKSFDSLLNCLFEKYMDNNADIVAKVCVK